jgi:hypothetical protein
MTTWGVRKISVFATQGGFPQSELTMASAVAWAATQGADHFVHNPGVGIGSERRGLWAMRMDEIPDGEAVDLFDPIQAASLALHHWRLNDGGWLWHPAVVSGAVGDAIELVDAVLRGNVRTVTDNPRAQFRSQLDRLASVRQQIAAQRIVRG